MCFFRRTEGSVRAQPSASKRGEGEGEEETHNNKLLGPEAIRQAHSSTSSREEGGGLRPGVLLFNHWSGKKSALLVTEGEKEGPVILLRESELCSTFFIKKERNTSS